MPNYKYIIPYLGQRRNKEIRANRFGWMEDASLNDVKRLIGEEFDPRAWKMANIRNLAHTRGGLVAIDDLYDRDKDTKNAALIYDKERKLIMMMRQEAVPISLVKGADLSRAFDVIDDCLDTLNAGDTGLRSFNDTQDNYFVDEKGSGVTKLNKVTRRVWPFTFDNQPNRADVSRIIGGSTNAVLWSIGGTDEAKMYGNFIFSMANR